MIRAALVILALGLFAMPVLAQQNQGQSSSALNSALSQLLGTIRVYSQPMMSNGALSGCTLVFDALHQDQAYRQGKFISVSGNVGFVGMSGTLGATVKIVLTDLDTLSMERTPAAPPPKRAYLVADDYSNNLTSLVASSGSDTPGAVFSIYQIEPAFPIVMAGLEKGRLTFAFNRGEGATDILLPIEIDVADVDAAGTRQRSPKAEQEFLSCMDALLSSLKE